MFMKKKNKNKDPFIGCWILLASILLLAGCSNIIEQDLSSKKVIIDAPTSDSLVNYNQLFWWETVDGALKYQLQIASPNFDTLQTLVLDTTVTSTKVKYTLAAGRYQWRVRALNGSSQTPYNGSKFKIYPADLNTQYVLLKSPANASYVSTVSTVVPVSWYQIPVTGITYEVQADQAGTFTGTLILDSRTQTLSANVPITTESAYYWRVRAYKGTDTTLWSSVNSFTYDITPPAQVTLATPTNGAQSLPITGNLTWTSLGAGIQYFVFVTYGSAAEVQFTSNTNSYSYTGSSGMTVKWRVQAVDLAGNKGTTSDTWSFKIQ
jgi:hypothetical protein